QSLLPRTATYYIRWAEAAASAECRNSTREFEDSPTARGNILPDLVHIITELMTKLVATYEQAFALYKMAAFRLYTLHGGNTVLEPRYGIAVYSPSEIYIGYGNFLFNIVKVGSPCNISLIIEYTDGGHEEIVLGRFSLGEVSSDTPTTVSFDADIIKSLATGTRHGRNIASWYVVGYCRGPRPADPYSYPGNPTLVENTWPFLPHYYANQLRSVIVWTVDMYLQTKWFYEYYCAQVLYFGWEVPPPSVVLPFDIKDLQKLPPEMRMQVYMAYLEALTNVDWTRTPEINASNVQSVYPGVILADGTWYTPLIVPVNIPVIVGYPVPLMGTWFVNGRIITYEILPVPEEYIYERIGNTNLYWIKDQGGNIVGVGVDINDDGAPDVYSPYYIVPEKLQIWDPAKQTWKEVNEFTFGPKPLEEIVKMANLEELIRRLREREENGFIESLRRFIDRLKSVFNLKTTTSWLAVAGLLLVILLLAMVAAGGRTRVMVVGGRALSPSKYLG
ncbi:MAG: hypothetical protein QW794_06825, partial [Thermosphaera sp.]